MSNFNCYCNQSNYRYSPCNCLSNDNTCCPRPRRRPSIPFLSSYLEGIGSAQAVNSRENIFFDIDEDTPDIAGRDIELAPSGRSFIFRREGLYHVEWSLNIGSADASVVIGLMENGEPISALANAAATGNHSSGALIQVFQRGLPYEISLHNFGGPIRLADTTEFQNVAASIRILRFADGAAM